MTSQLVLHCLRLFTETIVKTTQENISAETRRKEFVRADSGMLCTMCDTSHKDIVHNHASGELKLLAITLKGGQSESQGTREVWC